MVATVTEAVALLFPVFGSGVAAAMFAVDDSTVPADAPEGAVITTANVPVPFAANEEMEQVIVPACPTVGVLQFHPAGCVRETNVAFTVPAVLLAVGMVMATPVAVAGP